MVATLPPSLLFCITTTNLLLQSKPKDGKEGEHKSEGEEKGEEADGDEDEFGVRNSH